MLRLSPFVSLSRAASTSVSTVGLDFGSNSTRLLVNNKLVFAEPTCVAIHKHTGAVVAFGTNAFAMLGKTPPAIEVVMPVRRGRVVQKDAAQNFLTCVFQTFSKTHVLNQVFRKHVKVGIPFLLTDAERAELKQVVQNVSAANVTLETKAEAAWRGWQKSMQLPSILLLIDIGGATTEASFFAAGEVVTRKFMNIGGDDFTKGLMQNLRKQHHCEIGWQTAERMKKQIGEVLPTYQPRRQVMIRGRDVLSSLPTTICVNSEESQTLFTELTQRILVGVQELCEDTPAEIVTEALEHGVFLTGGGSVLAGLAEFFGQQLRTQVATSPSPFEDVVKGL